MKIQLKRLVVQDRQFDEIPPPAYFGLAYRDYVRKVRVYYPMPVNWLVAYWRKLRFWLDSVRHKSPLSKLEREFAAIRRAAYCEGHSAGSHETWRNASAKEFREGYEIGYCIGAVALQNDESHHPTG